MEIELKLLVDEKSKEALLQRLLLAAPATNRRQELGLSDTYFDTPELWLRHNEAGLRVRHVGDGWIQNLKVGSKVTSGLHQRQEWESAVAGPVVEPARLRKMVDDKKVRRNMLASAALGKRLAPIFTTELKRTVWEIHLPEGDLIECAFDEGIIECGDQKDAINELELELKSGDPVHLFDFALTLQKDMPLRLGNLSKADRGYALLASHTPTAVKASSLTLSNDMSAEQAFQAIAFNCITHIQANDGKVAMAQDDVESLHQMRVGMRRLRSALSMFKSLLHLSEDLQKELDWLAKELGDTRDWDVLAGSTLPGLAKDVPAALQIDRIQQAAADRAHAHHAAAAAAVGSARYTRLMLSLTRWVLAMGWRDDTATLASSGKLLAEPVTEFAHKTLRRDQQRLRTCARKLRTATPEARHRIRIAAKKTRYAAEFFDSLFAPKKVRPYVKALTGLQEELGLLNDATVADRLLHEMSTGQPQLEAQAGFVRGFLTARVQQDGKAIIKRWKKFMPMSLPR